MPANTAVGLRIAGLNIAVECRVQACLAAISSLCALYERADALSPALRFLVAGTGDDIRLGCNGTVLWRGRDAGEIAAAFEYHLYRRVTRALAKRFVSLHAAALAAEGRAVLFAGASGAGKSSLATYGVLQGMDYLSDEFALLDEDGLVHPFPRPLQWSMSRHPAFMHRTLLSSGRFQKAAYDFPDRQGRRLRSLLWLPTRVIRQPQRIHAVILPRFDRHARSTELDPLRRSQVLMLLARESHQAERGPRLIRLLHERLPGALPMFALHYNDVRQAWAALRQQSLLPAPAGGVRGPAAW